MPELCDPAALAPLLARLLRLSRRRAAALCDARVERCWPTDDGHFRFEWTCRIGSGPRLSIHAIPQIRAVGGMDGVDALRVTSCGVAGLSAWLPEYGLLVHSADCDPRMPHLRECLRMGWLRRGRRVVADTGMRTGNAARLLAYKAGRRAAILYSGRDRRGVQWLVGKTFRDQRAARLLDIHRRVAEQLASIARGKVIVPDPLALKTRLRMAIFAWIEGQTIDEAADAAQSVRAIDAVAALHRTQLGGLTEFSIADECAIASRWTRAVGALNSGLAARASELAEQLCGVANVIPPATPTVIHRDFYEKQVVVRGDEIAILDLDTLAWGDPAQDLGNYLSHWYLGRLATGASNPDFSAALAAVLSRYARSGGRVSARAILFYAASSLVRGGALHAFRTASRVHTPALWSMAASLLRSISRKQPKLVRVMA